MCRVKRVLACLALVGGALPISGYAQPVPASPGPLDIVPLDDLCEQAPAVLALTPAGAAIDRAVLRTAFCAPDRADAYGALQAVKQLEAAGLPVPRAWGLSLAARAGNSSEAWPRLEELMIESGSLLSSDVVEQAIGPAITLFNRTGTRARLDGLIATAVQHGVLDRVVEDSDRSGLAERAIDDLVQRDPVLAERLLQEITRPQAYLSMLALRSLAALWPALERRTQPGMADLMQRNLAQIEARLQREPGNETLPIAYVTTLRSFGHYDRAIATAFERTGWPTRPSAITEAQAWMLNEAAYSLDRVGRSGEGDAIMDYLAGLNPRRLPWVINFAVNRSARLADLGRSTEVMQVLEHDVRVARNFGSPYARLIMTKVQVCSLVDLGRAEEAMDYLDEIRSNQQASHLIAADAFLCLDQEADVARMLTEAMRDPQFHDYYARHFQGPAFDLPVTSGHMPDARDRVRSDPALKAQFERFARFLPAELALH